MKMLTHPSAAAGGLAITKVVRGSIMGGTQHTHRDEAAGRFDVLMLRRVAHPTPGVSPLRPAMTLPANIEELLSYSGFTEEDALRLQELHPKLSPSLDGVVESFYERIVAHPGAVAVFRDAAQIDRQRTHLRAWLDSFFRGPFAPGYVESRARVGRVHVRVGLPQRFVVASMHGLSEDLQRLVVELADDERSDAELRADKRAIRRLASLELALLLDAYHENYDLAARSAERLATLGKLAGTVAHEMRNPLAVLQTSAHLLGRYAGDDARVQKHAGRIQKHVEICRQIIDDLVALARRDPPQREHVAIESLVHEAWAAFSSDVDATLSFDVDLAPGAETLMADASQLRQVLINLLQNAAQASPEGGQVRLGARVRPASVDVGADFELWIEDEGEGFTAHALAHVFEPLFTTKPKGSASASLCAGGSSSITGANSASRIELWAERASRSRSPWGSSIWARRRARERLDRR